MSRRRSIERKASRHLTAVPPTGTPKRPTPVGFPVTIEIPTGGRIDVDGLIRELARAVFPKTLTGYEAKVDGPRMRCFVTVQPMTDFGPDKVQEGAQRITRALIVAGVLVPKPASAAPTPVEEPKTEGTDKECPPPSSPES